jgi:rhodanese-related sulfurtransferase
MPDTTPKTASQLVAEAKQRVENLTPDQVAAELERGDALLVDLRESTEREQNGVIPGAVHAPRGMLEFYADPSSPYHREEFDPNRRQWVSLTFGAESKLTHYATAGSSSIAPRAADPRSPLPPCSRWGTRTLPTSTAGSTRGSNRADRWRAASLAPIERCTGHRR